jgi:hypothetical protein
MHTPIANILFPIWKMLFVQAAEAANGGKRRKRFNIDL